MNAHKNARLTPHSRAVLVRRVVEDGQTLKTAAAVFSCVLHLPVGSAIRI